MNLDLSQQYDPPAHKKPARSGPSGCLIAVIITLVILGGLVLYVALNWKTLAARFVTFAIEKSIEQAELPAEQKQKLITRVHQLRDDYIAGKITDDQLKLIVEEIVDSPLLPVGMVHYIDQQYVTKSGLSEEEKKAAKLTLQRLARGVNEKKITQPQLDPLFRAISTTDDKGERQFKEKLTDAELRDFLKLAEKEVEKAKIPNEPLNIDLADELDKAIKRATTEPAERPF